MFSRLPTEFYSELKNPNTVLLQTNKFDAANFESLLFKEPRLTLLQGSKPLEAFIQEVEGHVKKGYYAAGYLSYEAADTEPRPTILSRGWFGIYDEPVRFDHRNESALGPPEEIEVGIPLKASFRFGRSADGQTEYKQGVETVLKHIKRGDTYQINLCGYLNLELFETPENIYRTLLSSFPVAYSSFVRTEEGYVISFSPELFFSIKGKRIVTAPMKGTARRGRTLAEDEGIKRELSESEKVRAENVMIVDLMRNDLTKIASNITVRELFKIEKFQNLFQMTSEVEGTLRANTSYSEIFKALFPSGSVTGAPKISSMDIIRSVELTTRGVYTGAIGYMAPNERAVFNVAIRTIEGKTERAKMGVGGAIVWDSKPEEEYQECLLKGSFIQNPLEEFSLFETILWDDQYQKLEEHLERLRESSQYFDYCFEIERCRFELNKLHQNLTQNKSAPVRVKLRLDRFGLITLEHSEANSWHSDRIRVWPEPVSSQNVFLFHKTTNRKLYDQATTKAKSEGLSEYIFVNERGEVTEGAISNLFIRVGGSYFTPPVSSGLLNGVERQHLMKTLPNCSERVLKVQDLKSADEIFICNSVRGSKVVKLLSGD